MATFQQGRYLIPVSLMGKIEFAQVTGRIITRTNQTPVYEDVLDEDGQPTGEQRRIDYEFFDEEIEEPCGGWALEALGDPDSAYLVHSSVALLDILAELGDVIELERLAVDGEPHGDAEIAPMMEPQKPPTKAWLDARRVAKNNKLRAKKMKICPAGMDDERDQCEHIIKQLHPNWQRGLVGI